MAAIDRDITTAAGWLAADPAEGLSCSEDLLPAGGPVTAAPPSCPSLSDSNTCRQLSQLCSAGSSSSSSPSSASSGESSLFLRRPVSASSAGLSRAHSGSAEAQGNDSATQVRTGVTRHGEALRRGFLWRCHGAADRRSRGEEESSKKSSHAATIFFRRQIRPSEKSAVSAALVGVVFTNRRRGPAALFLPRCDHYTSQ
ncbi:hypothetical protein EYF80_034739 [Liparis tanakae]|uniref:Uncharacterized protein n=1 Tax=Liparis tanakae TaxID=230148 RepID=A0A4Z2GQI6_9TELE|nr:hypothetical protein EYF80_034739 [Liparis tanakae]